MVEAVRALLRAVGLIAPRGAALPTHKVEILTVPIPTTHGCSGSGRGRAATGRVDREGLEPSTPATSTASAADGSSRFSRCAADCATDPSPLSSTPPTVWGRAASPARAERNATETCAP